MNTIERDTTTRTRAANLIDDIDGYIVAPPRRGGDNEKITGSSDPRRLPASETLLQISIDFGRFADCVASGNGASLLADPSIPLPTDDGILALVPALQNRKVAITSVRPGTRRSTLTRVTRLAGLEDRGDISDVYIGSIVLGYELRLSDWVRGHDRDEEGEPNPGSEW